MPFATTGTSPTIFKLNLDILWRIFTINAQEDSSRLETLRYTSQVCSNWRNLILESPALWSYALDVNTLRGHEGWKGEVIKRTGNTGLRIEASKDTLVRMEEFIKSVLYDHWARIRYLDLQFSYWCGPWNWFSILERPAPRLETFKITFHHRYPAFLSPKLFANDVPSLRIFSVINAALDLTTVSWAPKIRYLIITSYVSLPELLRSLFVIPLPFLEHLELAGCQPGETAQEPAKILLKRVLPVSFPCLRQIKINAEEDLEAVLSLLEIIVPADDCKLDFNYGARDHKAVHSIATDNIPNILSKYLRHTTKLEAATRAEFSLTRHRLHFSFRCLSDVPTLRFGLDFGWAGLSDHAITTFLSWLTTIQLDTVKKLNLYLSPPDTVLVNAAVERFIIQTISVEDLVTNTASLDWLRSFESRTGVIPFPLARKQVRN